MSLDAGSRLFHCYLVCHSVAGLVTLEEQCPFIAVDHLRNVGFQVAATRNTKLGFVLLIEIDSARLRSSFFISLISTLKVCRFSVTQYANLLLGLKALPCKMDHMCGRCWTVLSGLNSSLGGL